jgi:hypothetical protein
MFLTSKRAVRFCILALLIIGLLCHLLASGSIANLFASTD